MFEAIRTRPVEPDAEISIEANPGDPSEAYFRALRQIGINRLSLGVQTFDDAMLVTPHLYGRPRLRRPGSD